jgi:hypothetical protein
MLYSFRDLKTGNYHEINMMQISEFSIYTNECGVKEYCIHMSNGIVFTLSHKIWNRIRNKMRDHTK